MKISFASFLMTALSAVVWASVWTSMTWAQNPSPDANQSEANPSNNAVSVPPPAAAQAPRTLDVEWYCPQTVLPGTTTGVPVGPIVYHLPYDLSADHPHVDTTQLEALLPAIAASHRDFYQCLYNTLVQAEERFARAFINARGRSQPGNPERSSGDNDAISVAVRSATAQYRLQIAQYGQYAQRAGYLAALAPGEPISPADPANRAAEWVPFAIYDNPVTTPQFRAFSNNRFLVLDGNNSDTPTPYSQDTANGIRSLARGVLYSVAQAIPNSSQCPSQGSDPLCMLFHQRIRNFLQDFLSAFGANGVYRNYSQILPTPSANLLSCYDQSANPAAFLQQLVTQLGLPVENCVQLTPGQSTIVDINSRGSPIRYRLERASDGNYTAEVNLAFSMPPGTSEEALRQRLQACLDRVNPRYFPQTPDHPGLHLRLSPPGSSVPPAVRMNVSNATEVFRESSRLININTSCSTFIHELSHRIGLEDEYAELAAGFRFDAVSHTLNYQYQGATHIDNDCRAPSIQSSLMFDHNQAMLAAIGGTIFRSYECSATVPGVSVTEYCRDLAAQVSRSSTPLAVETLTQQVVAMRPRGENILVTYGSPMEVMRSETAQEIQSTVGNGSFTLAQNHAPERNSILFTGQAASIMHPGCYANNELYYQCAGLSAGVGVIDLTSRDHFGEGCPNGIPEECRSPMWIDHGRFSR